MSVNQQPTILAIETSTKACSAALLHRGEIYSKCEVGNNIHSKVLLEMVRSLQELTAIAPSDYDAIAVGQGPGSFTGLRIGVGVAQGIAYGAESPMIGVASLDILAQDAVAQGVEGRLFAGIDARMGEIYWAEYLINDNSAQRIGDMHVSPPSVFAERGENVTLVGNAWLEYWVQFDGSFTEKAACVEEILYPSGKGLLTLARDLYLNNEDSRVNAADFAPIYIRNDVAKKSSKPLPGTRV